MVAVTEKMEVENGGMVEIESDGKKIEKKHNIHGAIKMHSPFQISSSQTCPSPLQNLQRYSKYFISLFTTRC